MKNYILPFIVFVMSSLSLKTHAQIEPEEFSPFVAVDDYYTLLPGTILNLEVLLNDGCAYLEHPDCGEIIEGLIIEDFAQPENGEVFLEGDFFVYTPSADFEGYDMFYYQITNAQGYSSTGRVYVYVGMEIDFIPFAIPPCWPYLPTTCPTIYDCGLICNPNIGTYEPPGWAPGWWSATGNPIFRCTDPLNNDDGFIAMHRLDDCWGDAVITDFLNPTDPSKIQVLTYKRNAIGALSGDFIRFRLSNSYLFYSDCLNTLSWEYESGSNSVPLYDDDVVTNPGIRTVSKCFMNTTPYGQLGVYPKVTIPVIGTSNLQVHLDQIEVMEYPMPFTKVMEYDSCCFHIDEVLTVEPCHNTWTEWEWHRNGVLVHTGDSFHLQDYVCAEAEVTAKLTFLTDIQDHTGVPSLEYKFVFQTNRGDCCCEDYLMGLGDEIQCDLTTNPLTLCPPIGTLPTDLVEWDMDCNGSYVVGNQCYQPTGSPGLHSVCMKLTRIIMEDTCEVNLCKVIELEETDCEHFYDTVQCDDIYFDYSAYPTITLNRTADIDDTDDIYIDIDCDGIPEVNGVDALSSLPYSTNGLSCGWHCMGYRITRTMPDGTVCERVCEKEFYVPCDGDDCCCPTCDSLHSDILAGFTQINSGLTVTFIPNQMSECDKITWTFGDGSPSEAHSGDVPVTHTYAAPGIYNVCWIVARDEDCDGEPDCFDEWCWEIEVESSDKDCCEECNVVPNFNTSFNGGCYWVVDFNPTVSINASCTILDYFWDFGDGTSSALSSPTHNYLIPFPQWVRTYTPCMIVKYQAPDGEICFEEICKNVTVYGFKWWEFLDPIIIDFDYDTSLEAPNNIPFFPTGDISETDAITWDWGDESGMTQSVGMGTVFHQYEKKEEFEVCMSVKRYFSTNENEPVIDSVMNEICKTVNLLTSINPSPPPPEYDFRVYPNPVKNIARIVFDAPLASGNLEIFNINGQLISTSEINNQQVIDIDMKSFAAGLYYVVIRSKDFIVTKPLAKE